MMDNWKNLTGTIYISWLFVVDVYASNLKIFIEKG